MLTIALEQLICHDEGDGPGKAEPYIWPVFFKVDGESYAVTDAGFIGSPTVVSTAGHHGNLGTRSVDAGDIVRVPPGIGTYRTDFVPIAVLDPVKRSLLGRDTIPGVAGVVVVVMEEDGFPGHIARSGYDALVDAVHLAVVKIAAAYQHSLAAPTADDLDERISSVTGSVGKQVKGAVMVDMAAWQLAWFGTFGDQDDRVGTLAATVLSNEVQASGRIAFGQRWTTSDEHEPSEDGDWELLGAFVWSTPLSVRSRLLSRGHPAGSSLRTVMRPETSVWRWLDA